MTTYPSMPDLVEQKGSLFLRSDHMNYSRAILNSNWHQAREAEPKDYDMNKDPYRNLCRSTYRRIGNVTKTDDLPDTTYQNFCNQLQLKDQFSEQEVSKPLVNEKSDTPLERDTGRPDSGNWSVLPRHKPGHNKHHMETTHKADYGAPYPYTPIEAKPQEYTDYSMAHKRCISQFADTTRRSGRNTWQDESGVYHNSHYKVQCPAYRKTDPFRIEEAMRAEALEEAAKARAQAAKIMA